MNDAARWDEGGVLNVIAGACHAARISALRNSPNSAVGSCPTLSITTLSGSRSCIEPCLETVLSRKACIAQISPLFFPFAEPSVVKQLHVIFDDERHDPGPQAFLEKDQPSDAAVAQ